MTDFLEALPPRFTSKVLLSAGGCWIWTSTRTGEGYPQYWYEGRDVGAHRFAYERLVGPIPEGLQLDHLCRTPPCVRPSHLEPVTPRENTLRGKWGVLTTHCPSGHPYSEENTWRDRHGHRQCRTCNRARALANYHRKRAAS